MTPIASRRQQRFRLVTAVSAMASSVMAVAASSIPAIRAGAQSSEVAVRVVYDDRVGTSFIDTGWAIRTDRSREVVRSGSASMKFEPDAWGGAAFAGDKVDLRGATHASVWLHGGAKGGQNLRVIVKVNDRSAERFVRGLDNAWQEVRIPLSEAGAPAGRARVEVVVAGDVEGDQAAVYLDDVSLVGPAPSGSRAAGSPSAFDGGLVSFTFDDNGGGQFRYARPLLNDAGIKATFYTPTSFIKPTDDDSSLGAPRMARLAAEGHEIAAHSISHSDLRWVSDGDLDRELREPVQALGQQFGVNVTSFASPSGGYDDRELPQFERYYQSHRTALNGLNDPSADRFQLLGFGAETGAAKAIEQIDEAIAADRWIILIYHDVSENGEGFLQARRSDLARVIDHVKARGVRTARVDEGVARLRRPVALGARPSSGGKPVAILTAEQAKASGAAAPPTQGAQVAPPTSGRPPDTSPSSSGKPGGTVLFGDALGAGIEDWSFAERNMSSPSPARGKGKRAVLVQLSDWNGLYFHGRQDLRGKRLLEFWVHGGATGGQKLRVAGKPDGGKFAVVALPKPQAKTWLKMQIPIASLGLRPVDGVVDIQFLDASGKKQTPVSIDEIRFVP
jgi:peptidoglycan/xylan/chitin deacetylase (PgdA/CDA1 family)